MNKIWLSALAASALSACGTDPEAHDKASNDSSNGYETSDEMPVTMGAASFVGRSQRLEAAPAPIEETQVAPDGASPLLAYRYDMTLELPPAILAETQSEHAEACRNAGFNTCQIIAASVNNPDSEMPRARLELRATPEWLTEFRGGLNAETEAAGGSILADQTRVDDLTARIVDTQARVEAQTTLRDRLQSLLESREGSLSDLLAVERELAQVQANLDSQASVLAALRQRVDMSRLSLNYQPKRAIVTPGELNPIGEALKDVGEVFATSVASLILFLAGALPWLIIAVPVMSGIVIGFRRLLRRRKA